MLPFSECFVMVACSVNCGTLLSHFSAFICLINRGRCYISSTVGLSSALGSCQLRCFLISTCSVLVLCVVNNLGPAQTEAKLVILLFLWQMLGFDCSVIFVGCSCGIHLIFTYLLVKLWCHSFRLAHYKCLRLLQQLILHHQSKLISWLV